jgi:D-threo-aldose 1-dehydrogenase
VIEWGRLGLGCAQLGNLYTAIDDSTAAATVAAAWDSGVRYFDTAPHYGLGLSERRLGAALAGRPRDSYTISTKVGRLLVPDPAGRQRCDREGFDVPATHRRVWDFTADGVRRSLSDSLQRLGLDRVDLVLLHDPEDHARTALEHAYPALHELRRQGVVRAIGVGSKDTALLTRFVTCTDVDVVMAAGRYTLLEQPALDELLPVCEQRGIRVINVGVFNSGLLAEDRPHRGLPYEYGQAPADLVRRAEAIAAVCARHGTSLPAAAIAFAAAPAPVATIVVGAQAPEQVRRNARLAAAPPPPAAFWDDLAAAGLIRPDSPVPGGRPARPTM